MKSVSPVWPEKKQVRETIIGGIGYKNLYTIDDGEGRLISRWKLNWKERFIVFLKGDIYMWIECKKTGFNPVCLHVESLKEK